MKTQLFSLFRIAACAVGAVLFLSARVAPAGTVEDALEQERRQQTGTAITIVFDNSGSMNDDNKLVQAKAAFGSWLKAIPEDYKLSLITFENNGTIRVPLGEGQRENIAQQVAGLRASTNTPICASLRLAVTQIEERRAKVTPYERHVVLIFTDGEENGDSRGIRGVQEDIGGLRAANIEVVGIGFHGEGDYMGKVATRYCNANDEAQLRRGLSAVDAEIGTGDDLVVTAADLEAMKKAPVRPQGKPALADLPRPNPATPARRGIHMPMVFVILLVFFGLRAIGRMVSGK